MAAVEEVRQHLDLMRQYLAAAEVDAANGLHAPAHHHALHALELGLKAALPSLGTQPARSHNVGGQFGQAFRGRIPPATLRRINQLLQRYDDMRYPGTHMPSIEDSEAAVAFAGHFLRDVLQPLVERSLAERQGP